MKLIIILLILCASTANAQTKVKKEADGNYTTITQSKEVSYKPTGSFITVKDNKYPVYESSKGKLFYFRTSKKSGKQYKVYIKE